MHFYHISNSLGGIWMINWKNMDTLAAYEELKAAKKVNVAAAMAGENGAQRVRA